MGGERPAEGADKPKPKQEGISLIQAIGDDQRGDTRNNYPTSVAPIVTAPHKGDPFYHGPRNGRTHADYGGNVIDPATGRPVETVPGQPLPGLDQIHPEAANRDPKQRYTPSDIGRQVAGQNGQGTAREVQTGDADRKQQQIIARRGLVGDPSVDPDARGWSGMLRQGMNMGAAGVAGVSSSWIKTGIDKTAASTVERHAATRAEEGFLTRTRLAPARGWNSYISGEARLEPVLSSNAESIAIRERLVAAQNKVIDDAAAAESAKIAARARLDALNAGLTPNVATNKVLWGEETEAVGKLYMAEQATAKRAAALSETGVTASASKRFGNAILQTGLVQLAISGDRTLANMQRPDGAVRSTGYQQFLAPAAMALGEKMPAKLGYLALATAASRGLDTVLPSAPDAIRTPINMTDWKDMGMLATTLTIAKSVKNPIARVALVTAGVGITKGIHFLEDQNPSNLKNEVQTAREGLQRDGRDRSERSINNMTDNYRNLAGKKEDYVFELVREGRIVMAREWSKTKPDGSPSLSPEQKLNAYRQDAAMSRGLAEETIKQGTRLIAPDKIEYVAKGYDLDLNGTATDLLLTAGSSARKGAYLTENMITNNVTVNGAVPDRSEVDGLKSFDRDTQKKVDEIFDGKHDIKGAVDALAKYVGSDSHMDLQKSIIDECDRKAIDYAKKGQAAKDAADKAAQEGNDRVKQLAESDMREAQRMIAKLYRDEAVVMLAMAQNKLNRGPDGGGAEGDLVNDPQRRRDLLPNGNPKSFNGAQGAIDMAVRFGGDVNHPDVQQLIKLYNQMVDQVPEAKRKNYANPHLNPLNVDNGLYAP